MESVLGARSQTAYGDYTSFDIYHLRGALAASWVTGLGMPGYSTWSAAIFCGNNVHGILYMNQNAFESWTGS